MLKNVLYKVKVFDYKYHLLLAFLIRLIVIVYGHYHDLNHTVAFTDVDYKVFTDAARYVLNGSSPYNRHTYRYTPALAVLLVPNLLLHNSFGKVVFCLADVFVALLIRHIVRHCYNDFKFYSLKNKALELNDNTVLKHNIVGNIAMLSWLYNPLTLTIAARGNCDSLAALFVLSTLYILQCKDSPFYAGLLHGISVHFRLYPIMYSLSFFMYLSSYSYYFSDHSKVSKSSSNSETKSYVVQNISNNSKTIFKIEYLHYLIPNFAQFKLILGCVMSLGGATLFFYLLYGQQFLYESCLYHLVRTDTRHNFSLYFYLQYLSIDIKSINAWQKMLTVFPQFLLLVVFSIKYGLNRFALNFCVLVQTIVMVSYNTVVTSQYFVWILSVLPLCFWQINMNTKLASFLLVLWVIAQAAWLLPAYLLEFQGQNTFFFIWIQSISFFCANIIILGRLIKYFKTNQWKEKLS